MLGVRGLLLRVLLSLGRFLLGGLLRAGTIRLLTLRLLPWRGLLLLIRRGVLRSAAVGAAGDLLVLVRTARIRRLLLGFLLLVGLPLVLLALREQDLARVRLHGRGRHRARFDVGVGLDFLDQIEDPFVLRAEQPGLQPVQDRVEHVLRQPRQTLSSSLRAVLGVAAQRALDAVGQAVDQRCRVQFLRAAAVGVDGGVAEPAGRRPAGPHPARVRCGLRLPFDRLLREADRAEVASRAQGAESVRVLHGVQQFVREQSGALGGAGAELPGREQDVLPDGHRVRTQVPGELPGFPVGVQADSAEVVAEAFFQFTTGAVVERLAGAADDLLGFGRAVLGLAVGALAPLGVLRRARSVRRDR
nr:hypothetical protein [Saccharopolyspora gloriosae]